MSEDSLIDELLQGDGQQYSILFVDDESNILSALRRLFRSMNYIIFIAESGAAGIEILKKEKIDVVVSDMRMPEMNGVEFLSIVLQQWPDVARILLTGYADINSTIGAINLAKISRYISKPWDELELKNAVNDSLSVKKLENERKEFNKIVKAKNEKLTELNNSLEVKVQERTTELEKTMLELETSNEKIKKSFITSIKIFSSLIEMRTGSIAINSKEVADLARKIAILMKRPSAEVQDIFLAGLLHGIGKISLSDEILCKPFIKLSAEERAVYCKYPIKSQASLMALEQLQSASLMIRNQHERIDGLGFPDNLTAEAISMSANILGLSYDYEALKIGLVTGKAMEKQDAIKTIVAGKGKRYFDSIVDAFIVTINCNLNEIQSEREVESKDLAIGMTLSRDLISAGVMLLAHDYVLDERLIQQIMKFEQTEKCRLKILIKG